MENTKHLNGYIEEKDDTFYPTCRFLRQTNIARRTVFKSR